MGIPFWAYLIIAIVNLALGLIPASIAKSRGHSFLFWWIFGSLLFPLAFIVSVFLKGDLDSIKYGSVISEYFSDGGCLTPVFWMLLAITSFVILVLIFSSLKLGGSGPSIPSGPFMPTPAPSPPLR